MFCREKDKFNLNKMLSIDFRILGSIIIMLKMIDGGKKSKTLNKHSLEIKIYHYYENNSIR